MGDLKNWWNRYGLKLTALAAALLIIGAVYPELTKRSQTPSQLSAWDGDWNDISRFANDMRAEGYATQALLSSPMALDELNSVQRNATVLLILGVERAYTEPEAKAIREFVRQGGRVLLADDFGHGNSAVSGLYSVGASFFGQQLYDMNHWDEPSHPHNASYVVVDADRRADEEGVRRAQGPEGEAHGAAPLGAFIPVAAIPVRIPGLIDADRRSRIQKPGGL